jgi:tRNA threonylcarbamoyladenosine biosynthesis protein TsaE
MIATSVLISCGMRGFLLALAWAGYTWGVAAIALSLPDLDATDRLGARIAGVLRPGDAVLLEGPLGAGKSALARAILRALLRDPALTVPSPTFTLVQTYDAPLGSVSHFDLWRLDGPGAVLELGWDEARAGVVLVEWPDRLGALTPEDALLVGLDYAGETARSARLEGWAERLA